MVRDLDLPGLDVIDGRRSEVVVDGMPLATRCWCVPFTATVPFTIGVADTDSVVFHWARRRGDPELVGPGSRARLVVLALDVGGRWSAETRTFISQLAKAKARRKPRFLQKRASRLGG